MQSSNMPNRKKTLEWLYFNSFRLKVSDFPTGSVSHDDVPDFLISPSLTQEPHLGVEITQIFREHSPGKCPEQQFEAEELLIVGGAQKLAVDFQLPPLFVSVCFSFHQRPKKQDRSSNIEQLVNSISKNLPTEHDFTLVLRSQHGLPSEIDEVRVRRFPRITKAVWNPVHAGFVMEGCAKDFQKTINIKHESLMRYKQRCSICWLLIVADWFSGPAAYFEPSDETLSHEFTTLFERVYFLESFSGRVSRLRTVASIA